MRISCVLTANLDLDPNLLFQSGIYIQKQRSVWIRFADLDLLVMSVSQPKIQILNLCSRYPPKHEQLSGGDPGLDTDSGKFSHLSLDIAGAGVGVELRNHLNGRYV